MSCKGNCRGPGYYQKLITIEKLKTTGLDDDYGTLDQTLDASWETHTKAYARLYTRGGREFYQANQNHADLSHLWEVPDSSKVREITPKMRINWNGRIFQILSAQDKDENRQYTEISTKESV